MHYAFPLWAIAQTVMTLFSAVQGARLPVDEVFRRDQWDVKEKLESRQLCIYDQYLQSFEADPEDSVPFCCTFINIPPQTAVSTVYVKTTVLAIQTTTATANAAATVASSTSTVFITGTPAFPVRKRQAGVVTPASDLIAACQASTGADQSLITAVSSACTCLFPSAETITIPTTLISTRVFSAIDYERTVITNIITTGETTVTVTVLPSITPPPQPSSGIPVPSANSTGPLLGSVSSAPGNVVTTLPGSVATISGYVTTYPGIVVTLPRGGLPDTSPTGSPVPNPSSGFPPLSVNTTIAIAPTIASFTPPTSASGIPATPTNGSLTTAAAALPTGNVVPGSCPIDNGTLYTELGQTFEILCDTNFIGPEDQGFYVPSFYDCIHQCAVTNVGFSQSRCYAVSYIPNNRVGSDCFLRTLNNTRLPEYDPKATSAILINNTVSPDINYNATGGSRNGDAPSTALPGTNITSSPYMSTISANATTSTYGFPTASSNITASLFPTASANLTASAFSTPSANTTIPPFGIPGNDPRNGNGTGPSSAGVSSGFPVPTSNSSCGPFATTTVTSFIASTTIYMTADSSLSILRRVR